MRICIVIQTAVPTHFCLHLNVMERKYLIAGHVLAVKADFDVAQNAMEIEKFRVKSGRPDFTVILEQTESLARLTGENFSTDQDSRISVHREGEKIIQAFHEGICGEIFAQASIDYREKTEKIRYLRRGLRQFCGMRQCFEWMGIENIYAGLETVIMHSALVDVDGQGILFMGPSGVGKSTRADLWKRYADADILNGDRAFVNRDPKGRWIGYGSPYAGSSGFYVNGQTRLSCIAAVKRGGCEEIRLRRLNGAEAFKEVYKNTTACRWNMWAVSAVSDVIIQMIREIPVYEMVCPPDVRAVDILKKELRIVK